MCATNPHHFKILLQTSFFSLFTFTFKPLWMPIYPMDKNSQCALNRIPPIVCHQTICHILRKKNSTLGWPQNRGAHVQNELFNTKSECPHPGSCGRLLEMRNTKKCQHVGLRKRYRFTFSLSNIHTGHFSSSRIYDFQPFAYFSLYGQKSEKNRAVYKLKPEK